MFPYLSAVAPQIAYAHSVREFIRELLRRFIPGKWIDRVISDQDANFDEMLNAAFAELDEKTATEKDYCARVVSALCEEVSSVCEVTRIVCINRGYEEYADTYLSTEKFIRLLLRRDTAKLKRLNAALADKTKPLCVLLRDVGAVLEDRPVDETGAFGAVEAKKANAELKAIAADVKSTMQIGFAEVRSDIAAVGEKVARIRCRGKRRGKYDNLGNRCLDMWEAALKNTTLRNSLNTRVTYEAVFSRNKVELERNGIDTAAKFKRVIHAAQSKRSSDKIRELHARQDAARQKSAAKLSQTLKHTNNQTIKYGIMRDMKKNAKRALIFAVAIAGGLAAPLRSAASGNLVGALAQCVSCSGTMSMEIA